MSESQGIAQSIQFTGPNHRGHQIGYNYGLVNIFGSQPGVKDPEEDWRKSRAALFPTDPYDPYLDREYLASSKGPRVPGTCEWIREHALYQAWLRSDTRGLWICGGPGKGKTMLSIFVTEELERFVHDRPGTELLFYFCNHQDERRRTADSILRSLLYQMLEKRPKLTKYMWPFLDASPEARFQLDVLWAMLTKLLHDPDLGTVFCVLDGLDECDEGSLRDLLPWLTTLSSGKTSPGCFRLAVVSRDIPGLHAFPKLTLDQEADCQMSGDIQRFIVARVADLSAIHDFGPQVRAYIHDRLLSRAEGTFLWVGLVTTELAYKRTRTEVLSALECLPAGLPAMYGRMLLQLERSRNDRSASLLRWITIARRPLTPAELAGALSIEATAFVSPEQAVEDQITLCGPILRLFGSNEVGLVHQSARDYLLRDTPDADPVLESFRIQSETTHLELAQTCLEYIRVNATAYAVEPASESDVDSRCEADGSLLLNPSAAPFLQYAIQYWPEHARSASSLAAGMFDPQHPFFQAQSPLRQQWWAAYQERDARISGTFGLSFLHIASYLGIGPWVDQLLGRRRSFWEIIFLQSPVHERDGQGRTALFYAALGGHEAVVRQLLDRGADVNAVDADGWTALMQAAHDGILRVLLNRGADVRAGGPALRRAAMQDNRTVVQLLLDRGVRVDVQDGRGRTALMQAAKRGCEEVVRLLIDAGADVNIKDWRGKTALMRAAKGGHEEVMRLLIDGVVDIDTKDNSGKTALIHAAEGDQEGAVLLLLQKNAGVDVQDAEGQTALAQASSAGTTTVVKMLLDHGADANAKASISTDVLEKINEAYRWLVYMLPTSIPGIKISKATAPKLAMSACWEITSLILSHINAHSAETALVQAARRGHEAVVKELLDHGADVDGQDHFGRTAVWWAGKNGHEGIVRLLGEYYVDPGIPSKSGQTALMQAAGNGHAAVVQLLLEIGADVNWKPTILWPDMTPAKGPPKGVQRRHSRAKGGRRRRRRRRRKRRKRSNKRTCGKRMRIRGLRPNGSRPAANSIRQAEANSKRARRESTESDRAKSSTTPTNKASQFGLAALLFGGVKAIGEDISDLIMDLIVDLIKEIFDEVAEAANHCLGVMTGGPAIKYAARRGHLDVVKLLLDHGADAKSKDWIEWPALLWAAAGGQHQVMELLLQHHGCVNLKSYNEQIALFISVYLDNAAMLEVLFNQHSDASLEHDILAMAVREGSQSIVRLLLGRGGDANGKDPNGESLLKQAAGNNHKAVVQLLIDHGANINARDPCGRTALWLAVESGLGTEVRLLLDCGADASLQDDYGWTVFTRAAEKGHLEIVHMLLDLGIDGGVRNHWGGTPLMGAAAQGHETIVNLLVEHGVDCNARTTYGWSALWLAAQKDHQGVVQLLTSAGACL